MKKTKNACWRNVDGASNLKKNALKSFENATQGSNGNANWVSVNPSGSNF